MKNSIRIILQVALVGLLVLGLSSHAQAQSPPLWGKLSPGSYAVGFKSFWQLDYARRYQMTFEDKTAYAPGKAPRPILINIWYPAKPTSNAKPMQHRDYLDIPSTDPMLARFSAKLVEYDRGVITKELLGKPAKELNDQEKQVLEQFLDTPTASIRNAPPKEGKFPLVIYHSGNGSSFEDNAVLCEFLASHGYVVFGSAFQEPSGASFNVDNGNIRDFEYLIGYAHQLSNVDWNHIGVIGHSAGAHAVLTYRAQSHCAADAIVSLDTTQDYYSLADNRWEPMTTTVVKNTKNMTGPLLMVANPHAFFELADSLSFARRYYFTIKDLDHNDFISQGCIANELRYRLRYPTSAKASSDPMPAEQAKEKAHVEAVRTAYEALCDYVLHFLDAELKDDPTGKAFLAKQYRDTKLTDAAPHVVSMPIGSTRPEAYKVDSAIPPMPRQFRYFLHEQGPDKTVAVLKRFQKDAPNEPIYHHVFGFALVMELLEQGKTHDAIAFSDYYRQIGFDSGRMILGWGKTYLNLGRKKMAADFFKKVLLLEPNNKEAAEKLKELGESK